VPRNWSTVLDRSSSTAPGDTPAAPSMPLEVFERFDAAADRIFERTRGIPSVDLLAAIVSNLADYGFAWSVVAGFKGRHKGPQRTRALRALSVSGVLSAGVNTLVKNMVGRQRPGRDEPVEGPGALVRTPSSSSFPSGHTLAAFCTAVVLADSPAELVAFCTFAAAVAASRVHLGAHHASDVAGGALIGMALGLVARVAVPPTERA
jgi:membrane-associated phospholipid phosphatase